MKKMIAIALAVLMLVGLATVAFAEDSPVATVKHKITVTLVFPDGSTKTDGVYTVNDGESFSYTAKVMVDGYYFHRMVISGEWRTDMIAYSRTITIEPAGDLDILVEYKAADSAIEPETPATPAPAPAGTTDNSATSPDTGVNFALIALAVMMGLFGVVVSVKKLFVK